MNAVENINTWGLAFVVVFNISIVTRTLITIISGMNDEDVQVNKRIKNNLKAVIVVNSIFALIKLIKNYFLV